MDLENVSALNIGNILVIIGLVIFAIALINAIKPVQLICANCGAIDEIRKEKRGSGIMEITLWITLFIPGILYTIWRVVDKRKFCAQCNCKKLVPLDSQEGLEVWEKSKSSNEMPKIFDRTK